MCRASTMATDKLAMRYYNGLTHSECGVGQAEDPVAHAPRRREPHGGAHHQRRRHQHLA